MIARPLRTWPISTATSSTRSCSPRPTVQVSAGRIIVGDHLELWFWRITGGAEGSFLHNHDVNEQLGIIMRGSLDFRIGEPDDQTRKLLHAGDFYLAPPRCGMATASSSATTNSARSGSSTSSPRRARPTDEPGMRHSNATDPLPVADWRLAVDIGGTFTDVVLLDAASGRVVVDKTLTTPSAPLDGVRTGVRSLLAKAGVRPAEITGPIVHATTLITNALIEGKIGRAGVVTTAGFGDTLEIRNEHRYDMYDLQIEFPAPPVPRDRVVEIAERTNPHGVVESVPSPEGPARDHRATACGEGRSSRHLLDQRLRQPGQRASHRRAPHRELGVPVCISSEISPQIREYPRMITTACNAATMPVIGPYLDQYRGQEDRPRRVHGDLRSRSAHGRCA